VTNIQLAIAAYRTENNLSTSTPIPADAVTGSGSGLDPEISLANAAIQAPTVAKARNTSLGNIQALINQNIDGRSLGVFGEPGVNVLMLNIVLDQKYPVQK
jgi:K+-transporting ATPase ATPase C chain